MNCWQSNDDDDASDYSGLADEVTGAAAATGLTPIVDCLSRCIVINSINCALLGGETRCRQAMRQVAERRRRLVSELAMRCPPLTAYGPASAAAGDSCLPDDDDDRQSIWNHSQTRPFDAVDAVRPSQAARLTDSQVKSIGEHSLGDGTQPHKLTAMLRKTAEHYICQELERFANDVVPALFDVLAARQ